MSASIGGTVMAEPLLGSLATKGAVSAVGALVTALAKAAPKLMADPDEAGKQVGIVLTELAKCYQVLDDALVEFQSLVLTDPAGLAATRKFLRRVEGGRVITDIAAGRGHC